jgi:hypothetical protein
MEIRVERPSWSEDQPIFASDAFLRSQSPEYGWLVGARDGLPWFALPYTVQRKAVFRFLRFQTAPIALEAAARSADQAGEAEQDFLDSLPAFLRRNLGADFIAQPPNWALFARCPAGSIGAPFGSYRLDLAPEEPALWKAVHTNHRNVIRIARRSGAQVERGPQWRDAAYRLYADTLGRSHMAVEPRAEFEHVLDAMGGHAEIHVVLAGGVPQGSVVTFFSRHRAYAIWAGSLAGGLRGSVNLLYWEILLDMKSRGARTWDFVGARLKVEPGSKLEGIQRFKAHFGTTLVEGRLWKLPLRPFRAAAYEAIRRMRNWRSAGRGGDIIDQERARLRREGQATD